MKLLIAYLLLTASALPSAPATAQVAQRFWMQERVRLETDRMKVKVELLESEYRLAFIRYDKGDRRAQGAIDAAYELLVAELELGLGQCAIRYDNRIIEIERVAERNLAHGIGVERDVQLAEKSRLDALIKRLVRDHVEN